MPHSSYLALADVTAMYGETRAVSDVTIEVTKGELISLLGPSGCGKTTTLRMIAGFVRPAAGKVVLNGADITAMPAHRRNIGVVFQSYALFPHLTVIDNVGFGLRMRHVPAARIRERALTVLETVGLTGMHERYPAQLSGGQQQRVALARALVIEPDVLLLDEPLSNLDAHLRADMRAEIRSLQQRLGITTVFVTHDQQEALAISDRIVVMSKGVIAEVGRPEQLCDRPASPFTASFLGARTVIEGTTRDGVFHAPGLSCAGAPEGADRVVLRAARLRISEASGPPGIPEAPGPPGISEASGPPGISEAPGPLGIPEAPGPLALRGTVAGIGYLGDVYEVDVRATCGTVRLLVPSELPPPPLGTACEVRSLPGGATFIRSH